GYSLPWEKLRLESVPCIGFAKVTNEIPGEDGSGIWFSVSCGLCEAQPKMAADRAKAEAIFRFFMRVCCSFTLSPKAQIILEIVLGFQTESKANFHSFGPMVV